MSKKKIVALALSVAILAVVIVGASLAYLSDRTQVTTNTFTVGKVKIELDEHKVDATGKKTTETTKEGNTYNLLPGVTYDKDPFVTVKANSEDCYVRVKVTLDNADKIYKIYNDHNMTWTSAITFFGGYDQAVWIPESLTPPTGTETTCTVTFRYKEVVAKSTSDQVLPEVIKTITLPSFVTGDDLASLPEAGFHATVVAEAIQAASFADADAAWAAFDAQMNSQP